MTRTTPVRRLHLAIQQVAVLIVAAMSAVACEAISDPARTPLDGLAFVSASDSSGNPPPPTPPGPLGSGYVHGTVLGPSAPGAGNDSLLTAPRVVGARVRAYVLVGGGTITGEMLGDPAAEVTTGSEGKFQLPSLEGGSYVITFTPPEGSAYVGVWATATIHSSSHEWPWWVVLPKR